MVLGEIQLSMFPTESPLIAGPETLQLMRPHKWAHGETVELPLVSIELVPHETRWMWQSNLNSKNGSGQSAKALPKWNKFAASKQDALIAGIEDVLTFLHRATAAEQQRITQWLRDQVSRSAVASNSLE